MPKLDHQTIRTDEFARRLVELMEANGQPRRGAGVYLENKYGVSNVTANAWLNGVHRPAADMVRKIAEDHGCTFDELYFGDQEGPPRSRQEFVTIPAPGGGSEDDDVMVRFLPDRHASAGHGSVNDTPEGSEPLGLRFSARSLRKKGIPPEKAFIIYARGDSMEPDISDGDAILLDTSRAGQIKDGRPYVIEVDGEESVKILHRRPGGVVLVQSKNSDYPPYEVSMTQDGFRVLGEVMWTAGWL